MTETPKRKEWVFVDGFLIAPNGTKFAVPACEPGTVLTFEIPGARFSFTYQPPADTDHPADRR